MLLEFPDKRWAAAQISAEGEPHLNVVELALRLAEVFLRGEHRVLGAAGALAALEQAVDHAATASDVLLRIGHRQTARQDLADLRCMDVALHVLVTPERVRCKCSSAGQLKDEWLDLRELEMRQAVGTAAWGYLVVRLVVASVHGRPATLLALLALGAHHLHLRAVADLRATQIAIRLWGRLACRLGRHHTAAHAEAGRESGAFDTHLSRLICNYQFCISR